MNYKLMLIILIFTFSLTGCIPDASTTIGSLFGIPPAQQQTVPVPPTPVQTTVLPPSSSQNQMVTLTPIAPPVPAPVNPSPVTVEPFDLIKLCIADALNGDFTSVFNSCLDGLNLIGSLASYAPQLIQYLTGMGDGVLETVWAGVFGLSRSVTPYEDYVNKGAVAAAITEELLASADRSLYQQPRGFGFIDTGQQLDVNLVCQVE